MLNVSNYEYTFKLTNYHTVIFKIIGICTCLNFHLKLNINIFANIIKVVITYSGDLIYE